jgi:uncharacterized protein (DUF1330 family)
MTVYMIARMEITDPERYKDYGAKAPALFAKHGGHYLGGGSAETLEGPEENRSIALIAFPDRAAAEAYYNDPDYAPVRAIRWEATQSELILIDGYEG